MPENVCGLVCRSCANNCILADEMGLGKTIQCISLLGACALVFLSPPVSSA